MIDNFEAIEKNLLDFQAGSYYKFEALVRNTDGPNPLYLEGASNTNKNILIKTWWVEDLEYYNKIKKEMKVLCDMTGARLYVLLDRKSVKKTIVNLQTTALDMIMQSYVNRREDALVNLSPKTLCKLSGTASSIAESSDRDVRHWMFDIDTNDFKLLETVQAACYPHSFFTLGTKKGYHVCVKKKDLRVDKGFLYTRYPYLSEKKDDWCVQENAMGLVYIPDTDFRKEF